MEVKTAQPPFFSGSSSAAYPRWVMLEKHYKRKRDDDSSSPLADARTLAAARTTTGHRIQVSLCFAEPPATSPLLVELPDGVFQEYATIAAAHGDSLLIQVSVRTRDCSRGTVNQFVYSAGDAAAAAGPPRPPMLALLPLYYFDDGRTLYGAPVSRPLRTPATGMLRSGEDETVLAELEMVPVTSKDTPETKKTPELFMFRSGEWIVRRPRICSSSGEDDGELVAKLPSLWRTDAVVPAGDGRTLCWVDLGRGVLFSDVLEEIPWLQYLPLPVAPCFGRESCRSLRATAAGELKFVNIFPRCCCGGAGASRCKRSDNAYTIQTWSLRMGGDMVWVMDAMVDATELWGLETYNGLPRVPLDYPVVSMEEPHVICFLLCEDHHVKHGGDRTLWMPMIDMRSKTIRSVSRYTGKYLPGRALIPSSISNYFNSCPNCSSDDGTTLLTGHGQNSQMDHINEKLRDDDSRNLRMQSSCKPTMEQPSVQTSEILAVLKEIPSYGLCVEDMLKAYSILSNDDGSRFRSLFGLPWNLKKDWLLMEIKAGDACPIDRSAL